MNSWTQIQSVLDTKKSISPFLLYSNNLELLEQEVYNFCVKYLGEQGIDKNNIFVFQNEGKNIKLAEIKDFFQPIFRTSPSGKQIFIINDISRLSVQSGNSCLKILEEPGEGNIIFLTNISSSGVLDTIISRVQEYQLGTQSSQEYSSELLEKIENMLQIGSTALYAEYFSKKFEKQDAIIFLKTLLYYYTKQKKYVDFLSEIPEDIVAIEKNNVNGKYIVDKYLLKM